MNYIYKQNGSIVLFANQKTHTIDKSAINYGAILEGLTNEDWETVKSLLDVRKYCSEYTNGMVEIAGNDIYLNGSLVRNGLARRMVKLFKDNMNIDPMCRFMENLSLNPSKDSIEELYGFLENNDLPLTSDGYFLAYKKVGDDYLDSYSHTIRNMIGDEVSMPRELVDNSRHNTCSTGLHFASYNYVRGFYGSHLMVLKIHPKDVVSIPVDYENAKGRCCHYVVVDEVVGMDDTLDKGYTNDYGFDADDWLNEDEIEIEEVDDFDDSSDVDGQPHDMTIKAQNNGSKLTEDCVREIRDACDFGVYTLKEIGLKFGISPRQVGRIRDRESWWWVN